LQGLIAGGGGASRRIYILFGILQHPDPFLGALVHQFLYIIVQLLAFLFFCWVDACLALHNRRYKAGFMDSHMKKQQKVQQKIASRSTTAGSRFQFHQARQRLSPVVRPGAVTMLGAS